MHPYWLVFLVGIGTSLLAAALVTLLSPASDELYQQFVALGIRDIWPSRRDVPSKYWCEWLEKASRTCTLLGVAHGEWRNDVKFGPALVACLQKGAKVNILFLDPNSELAKARAREEQRDTEGTIKESIRIMWGIRNGIDPNTRIRLHLRVYDSNPSSVATLIDDFMIVTHYLAGFPNRTSPAFRVVDLGPESLFGVYKVNIDRVFGKESTIEITEDNIEKFIPKRV